jgi:hypothetical protein
MAPWNEKFGEFNFALTPVISNSGYYFLFFTNCPNFTKTPIKAWDQSMGHPKDKAWDTQKLIMWMSCTFHVSNSGYYFSPIALILPKRQSKHGTPKGQSMGHPQTDYVDVLYFPQIMWMSCTFCTLL